MDRRTVQRAVLVLLAAAWAGATSCSLGRSGEVSMRIGQTTLEQVEVGKTTEEWLIAILGEPTSRSRVQGLLNVEVLRYTTSEATGGFTSVLTGGGQKDVATTYFIMLDGVVQKFWHDRPDAAGLLGSPTSGGEKREGE